MAYHKLLVFTMGKHKEEKCNGDCPKDCPSFITVNESPRCYLYSCRECGNLIQEGEGIIRVVFQATKIMQARRQYLYGKGQMREPKSTEKFLNYHIDCYKSQLSNWIEAQLEKRRG